MAAHQAPPSLGFSRQEHWSGLPVPSPMHEGEKWKWSRSVLSDSERPHGLQPTGLLRPWDFPGKSTGVGCHCLQLKIRNGEGNGNPFQYSCLENFRDRGAWWAAIYGVTQSWTQLKRLSSSSSSSNKEFKVVLLKMFSELGRRMNEHSKKFKK